MNISIKRLSKNATLPNYAHPGDAGMDVYAAREVKIQPGLREVIPTGIAMEIPEGYVGLVWDKSGRAVKDGLKVMAGVIDAGYRGEVGIVLLNVSEDDITIAAGEKIAQILIQPVISPTLVEVEELSDAQRGENGFGSTGI